MNANQPIPTVEQVVRSMRIILFALCMGVVSFGGVVLFVGGSHPPKAAPLIVWFGLGMGASVVVVRQVLRLVIPAGARKGIVAGTASPDRLISVYQTIFIVSAALLEGACFFNLICYMVEGQWASLAFVGFCLLVNLSTFPSKDGVETWIQQQLELIDLERQQVN